MSTGTPEKKYVMLEGHKLSSGAYAMLTDMGAAVFSPETEHARLKATDTEGCELFAVFVSDTTDRGVRFPGKYLRVLGSRAKAQSAGFPLPEALASFIGDRDVTCIVIRPSVCGTKELQTALLHVHNRAQGGMGRWIGIRKDRPSGMARFRARQQRRAHENRLEYAIA